MNSPPLELTYSGVNFYLHSVWYWSNMRSTRLLSFCPNTRGITSQYLPAISSNVAAPADLRVLISAIASMRTVVFLA